MGDNLKIFKNVLRVLWGASGILFVWCDVKLLGNTGLAPSFWLILGVLAFFGATMGLTGGLGAALFAQGFLKYRECTFFELGKITFSPEFTLFDKFAHAFFVVYGIFLVIMQIRKNIRRKDEGGADREKISAE